MGDADAVGDAVVAVIVGLGLPPPTVVVGVAVGAHAEHLRQRPRQAQQPAFQTHQPLVDGIQLLDQRLAAAEQRLTQLDLQAQAAAGNAERAESLLIAFATRRAVARGAELGYLSDQLRLRFGDQWPNAVSTIIEFSRNPIRLDSLVARLEGLGPQLRDSSEGPSWAAFQREVGQLFVFRRESTPSPQPQRRLDRARWALEQGRYRAAIDEVKGMPGASKADAWIADAERYRKVSAESGSPWPGDFRVSRVPYLREPQDCLHPDHPARRVQLTGVVQHRCQRCATTSKRMFHLGC